MKKWLAKIKCAIVEVRDFLDEKAIGSVNRGPLSRLHRFAHFWLMVAKSFSRNRCPIRASALAYTSLLALIPMLFVALSVSSSILKKQGAEGVNQLIDRVVSIAIPPIPAAKGQEGDEPAAVEDDAAKARAAASASRQRLVNEINGFIQNIQPASLGITGVALLVFVAISMISRIEATFNDIWGVSKCRSFISQIIHYWSAISLGAILLAVALALAGGPHLQSTKAWIESQPVLGTLLFGYLPTLVLCVAFAIFYMLMPNTKVHFRAALAGGIAAGLLWHLNNYLNSLFVSRVVTNSKIYGSLAMLPVFMIGLYFSWLILLFGAQIAYAWQNRAAYRSEKQTENINQRGREFVALRLMQCIGGRFQAGQRPATVPELADALIVPTRLVQQIMQTLLLSSLVVEVVVEAQGRESAYSPARPLDTINCHDILLALRAGQGQELATRDDPARLDIYGEYEKILEAERRAASGVTVLAMASRAEELSRLHGPGRKAVTDSKK